jgi:amidophosphoribosyltransferase
MRSHYMGRTFIEPSQQIRHFGVKLKLSPVREVLAGQRVIVVDDSIVRGTTSRKIVDMIRSAGAREVHMRISSPPTIGPCRYGIDTPTREELIASHNSIEQIRDLVGADSLGYLSLPGLYASVEGHPMEPATKVEAKVEVGAGAGARSPAAGQTGFCDACFSGNYPIASEQPARLRQLRLISQ